MQTYLLIGVVSLIALTMFLILIRIMQHQWMKFFELMFKEIQTQNKLLASKDLTTFSTLKTLTTNNDPSVAAHPSNIDPTFVPMDDASVAKRLAGIYKDRGLDPSLAYDNPMDVQNDLADLGLIERGGN